MKAANIEQSALVAKYRQILSGVHKLSEFLQDELGAMIWSEFFSEVDQDEPEVFTEDDIIAMLRELQVRLAEDVLDLEEAFDAIEEMVDDLDEGALYRFGRECMR